MLRWLPPEKSRFAWGLPLREGSQQGKRICALEVSSLASCLPLFVRSATRDALEPQPPQDDNLKSIVQNLECDKFGC